jgi:hypothetical protein
MYTKEKKDKLCQKEKTILYETIHFKYLSARDKKILQEIGIPGSAAPYLSFCEEGEFGGFSLRDRICNYENVPLSDVIFDSATLDHACVLGQCGIGYIVINKRGELWVLDHESADEYYANQSLDDFLDCVYEYRSYVDWIHEKYGQNTFIGDLMTEEDMKLFEQKLLPIDPEVLDEDTFWYEEIQNMYADMGL